MSAGYPLFACLCVRDCVVLAVAFSHIHDVTQVTVPLRYECKLAYM